jgi:hypothetical protein
MLTLIRRLVRRIAGLPPHGAPQVQPGDLEALWQRIEAMDRGLGDQIAATREETHRALLRMRAELDSVIAQLEEPTIRSTNDS